jgi:hypothetical protein
LAVVDNAYGQFAPFSLAPEATKTTAATTAATATTTETFLDVDGSGNWYDITVSATRAACGGGSDDGGDGDEVVFSRTFMGRLETGSDLVTDPAMGQKAGTTQGTRQGAGQAATATSHPVLSADVFGPPGWAKLRPRQAAEGAEAGGGGLGLCASKDACAALVT